MLDHFHVPIEDQVRVNREDLHRTTADIFSVMGLSQELKVLFFKKIYSDLCGSLA